jgi:hypothetical protein
LIRDRDSKFTATFDAVFTRCRHQDHRTPIRAASREPIAERVIGTLRRECLDHLFDHRTTPSRHRLREYVQHFNTHRPHRALDQRRSAGGTPPHSAAAIHVRRHDQLGRHHARPETPQRTNWSVQLVVGGA